MAEHSAQIQRHWDEAQTAAIEIAEMRGIKDPIVSFRVTSDGERSRVTAEDSFYYQAGDELMEISEHDEDCADEEYSLWGDLHSSLEELSSTGLPPLTIETAATPDDLESWDTELMLFADFDADGYFQYDEKGMKTIIDGQWF